MPTNQQQLLGEIRGQLEGDEASVLTTFSNLALEKSTPEFLGEFDPPDLLAALRGALEFLDARKPDEILIRVYNPDPETQGWRSPHTILEIALKDRPFIVDSLRACLRREGFKLIYFLHPIIGIARDEAGKLIKETLGRSGMATTAEAYEMFLLERIEEKERLEQLEQAVSDVLGDVVLATDDYQEMQRVTADVRDYINSLSSRLRQIATLDGPADLKEYADFMDWLLDDNFVFLGYRTYQIKDHGGKRCLQVESDSALGILRKLETSSYHKPVPLEDIPEGLRQRITSGPLLLVTKSNAESTVHRPARMDYIGIKRFDEAGQAAGERRILGLFTSKAHSTAVDLIPILRRKLKQVLALDDAVQGSHDFKQMITIFNSMPREELFWSAAEQLHRDIRTIMSIEQERGVRVTVRPDPLARGLALMVIMPRERFNTEVRLKIQKLLTEKLEASHVDYHLAMGEDEAQIRFHFFFTTHLSYDAIDLAAIDREVAELTRSWEDQLQQDLQSHYDQSQALQLAEFYAEAFDQAYKAENDSAEAIPDIANLEALGESRYLVDVHQPPQDSRKAAHLKIYHHQRTLVLSEVFPLLENLGVRVIEQISHPLAVEGENRGIDIFRVLGPGGKPLDLQKHGELLIDAMGQLLESRVENDRLNQLVIDAGLSVRQISLLRTYRGYLSQLQAATSRSFITETLINNPQCARIVYRLFEAKFQPGEAESKRKQQIAAAAEEFSASLDKISSLPEDHTLRSLFQLIQATVRSNFFQNKAFISLKIRSADVEEMPEPRPMFEIVVDSPGVEGIHLRGGRVARGGLRWSDRPDDYRTEVLGLMKTQMTKNAVIVPVGSKGGFVVKHPPAEREELQAHVRVQYKTFVRGLLDLTDNIVEGKTVHPEGMVIFDEPDPYLVVAADKGTATFSDTANEISREYNFWLGDAFASGGSYGYDHKKEAITARGAWECVARHFREKGIDIGKEEFTAVGIGDMSGDVFGNGLLYTDKIRLLAAFNHLHIFVDPDPEAKSSFRERRRLFNLARSSWEDFNPELISQGGGVFSRQAKSIPLSPEMKVLLGTDAESLSGRDLIRTLLQLPADLLWNGGIGTYVKSSAERNPEVGDTANDAVRVDAAELRFKVVGEGGNLGFTQLARIEFAAKGGRINTDAIDNSAGVDMSDHEVNIKILLQPRVQSGKLSFEERNSLLKEMTDDVNRLVLKNNYNQSLCLSLAERASRHDLAVFESLLEHLAGRGDLKPAVEFLPGQKEFEKRRKQGVGLTRPELSILLAYTKMALQRYLLGTELPDEKYLQHHIHDYFPEQIRKRFAEDALQHPLRREIIALQLTNMVVDHLGVSFVHGTIRDTGATPAEVIRTALAALEILDLTPFWKRIFELDNKIDPANQYEALEEVAGAVEGVVQWILLSGVEIDDLSRFVETYRDPLARVRATLADLLPVSERKRFEANLARHKKKKFVPALAADITSFEYLTSAMGVIDAARATGVSLEEVAKEFYALGDRLSLGWLRDSLNNLRKRTKWEKIACGGLVMDLRNVQRQLTIAYLQTQSGEKLSVSAFLARYPKLLKRFDQSLWEIRESKSLTLTNASVLTRLLLHIVEKALAGSPVHAV